MLNPNPFVGLLLSPFTLFLQASGAGMAFLGNSAFDAFKRRCDIVMTDHATSHAAVVCDVALQVMSVEYRDSLRAGKGGDSMVTTVLNRMDPFAYSGVVALADRTQVSYLHPYP